MSRDHRARSLARGHTSPRFWIFATQLQMGRIETTRQQLSETGPSRRGYDALGIDVHFLLVAIKHLLGYQESYLELTDDERLRQGLEKFDRTAIDSTYLRNMLEHLDKYVVGEGRHQDEVSAAPRELQPMLVEAGQQLESDFQFVLGDYSIPVKATASAAVELGELLETIWNDHFGHLKARQFRRVNLGRLDPLRLTARTPAIRLRACRCHQSA